MFSKAIVDDYKKAVLSHDWPSQAGILMSLLRIIVENKGSDTAQISEETAKQILAYRSSFLKRWSAPSNGRSNR